MKRAIVGAAQTSQFAQCALILGATIFIAPPAHAAEQTRLLPEAEAQLADNPNDADA